ncbi:hypothetical protein GCM10027423_43790 [Spirosoma arcticum]
MSIVVALVLTVCPVHAQKTYWVSAGESRSPGNYIAHYEDTTARLTMGQVVALDRFKPLDGTLLNRGYTASHHWLRLRLNARTPQTAFVEIDNPRINNLWCYQVARGRVVRQTITGDALPFWSRAFPGYNWIFPVALDAKTPTDVFVMVAKRHEVLGVRVRVWDAPAFETTDRNRYLLWGLLAGFSLLILLVNMVAFLATRDTVYFWFSALILAIAFHISTQSGLGFQYLWPGSPAFNRFDSQLLSGWLIMLAQLQFMQQFIGQKAAQSRAFRAVQVFKYGVLALLVLTIGLRMADVFPQSHFRWTFNTTLALIVVCIGLAFWSIFERIRQRENVVLFYTFTFSVQLVGYLIVFFINLAFTRGQEPLFQIDSYVVIVINFLFDLLILSSGILFFWFQTYRQQNETLLTALHQSEQEQSRKIIDALEVERNRIAEDLYDDVGAMLSTAIGYVSSVLRKPDVKERFPALTEARTLLDRSVENLRTVSHNLMPKNFAQLGLSQSLAETIDKVAHTSDVAVDYVVVGTERRLSAATEVQIFRIAAELLNDILKNSTATQATVQLIYNHDHLSLMAEDDAPRTPAYNNLTSKVQFLNGTLAVDTTKTGVTAVVEIPYHEPDEWKHQQKS